ncbi:MAG: hypothetical protein NT099_09855 [Candidatus Saganbacteria bacterium]|nr:hypothetical protein [Candidatus Saganbacteria bacterium]
MTDTDREVSLIRTCILLRVFGSYGIAVELLIQRFNSGLPVDQTRQWLSFLLKEIGDTGAASEIFSSKEEIDKQKESTKAPLTIPKQTKLKYGVVMLSMFDSEVFRSSLTSLKNSGFPGEIVVVEDGYHKGRNCEDFCRQMLVKYVKSAVWVGESGAANLGIEQFDKDTDIVVYSHSDVLWPKNWFGHFNHIWERVYDQNKVGILNLGYLQCKSNVDAALYKLFVDCKYDELVDILLTIKDIPVLADYVQNLQIKNGYENFGFTLDPWNNNSTKLRTMTGRFSPVASFLMQTWQNIGKFDPNMSVGMDLELQYDGLKNHRWNLWTNNAPIVHFVSGDTISIAKQDQKKRMEMINTTSKLFQEKYGIGADHFFSTYFAGTSVIFADEIVKKANEWRFADIDFIFDDFFERLKR